jgi:glycosyltransferase involved in cell wall biosynthesis
LKEYVGETRRMVRIVYNGISEPEFLKVEHKKDAYDLVYLGELRPAKGVEVLISALALLKKQGHAPIKLLIIGSGPSEDELKELVEDFQLSQNITFEGPQPIRHALEKGKVMVIPSRAESLPYVILEAAAAAQPLISTNVGGIPEIFGPHSPALIVAGNVDVMARAIAETLSQPDEIRQRNADQLRDFVQQHFSLDTMVSGVLAGYEAALATKTSAA